VPLDARRLPIASSCTERVRLASGTDARAWCDHCAKPVHLLSDLRESEVRALIAAHAGKTLCVEYRTREDGTIVTRPPPSRTGLATALAGLAAWSPAAGVVDAPADQAIATPSSEQTDAPPRTPEPSSTVQDEAVIIVNFRLTDGCRRNRGAVVVGHADPWHRSDRADRLVWVPTRTLWRQMIERWRARRAARAGAR
jgi:hypothetical protein